MSEQLRTVTIRPLRLGPKKGTYARPPRFAVELKVNERIVGVEHHSVMGGGDRKTDDYYLTVYVEERR